MKLPFTYTDNGNLSDNSRWKTFGYNEENRLSDSAEESASYQNTYDALGGRCFTYIHRNLEKSSAEYTLNYATPTKRILTENITSDITRYNGTHVEREDTYYYIWGANGLAARIDTIGRLQYYYADDQGNILALTDADNGTPLREYFYLPYGDYVSPASGFYNPFSYSGSYGVYNLSSLCRHTYNPSISYINFAPDGNLYHAGARHYHSHFKTWLTPDGIGTLGQISVGELNNLYLYGRGAPNVYVDPEGKFVNFIVGGLIGGGIDLVAQGLTKGFDNINYASVGISALAGASGVGLGGVISKNVATIGGRVAINAVANAAVGATAQVANNAVSGEDLSKGLKKAVGINFVAGGLGSAFGEGLEALGKASASLHFDKASLYQKLLAVSQNLEGSAGSIATKYTQLGNLGGQVLSNSGPVLNELGTRGFDSLISGAGLLVPSAQGATSSSIGLIK